MTHRVPKKIAILGSTGSIGQQALELISENSAMFSATVLTAQHNARLLVEQALQHRPAAVVIGNRELYGEVRNALSHLQTKVYAGSNAIEDIVTTDDVDTVLTALVGISGLIPTINAIRYNKKILLANKETLVVAGGSIARMSARMGVDIIPVDSEHSAVFQCLAGEAGNPAEKIFLTASGGPFRGMNKQQLSRVTKNQALNHPNWDMGDKISIDSATMMNKGLEVMAARWLFDLEPSQIEVIIHTQSVIHSIVQFEDGSMKAQMGLPDMKQPILYALGHPNRIPSKLPRFSFTDYPRLDFEPASVDAYECLDLSYQAMHRDGNIPCVLNAANEVAVSAFLHQGLAFLQIPEIIRQCMEEMPYINDPGLQDLMQTDQRTREKAHELIKTILHNTR